MLSAWKVCCSKIPQRWVFAVMGCLAITTIYTMRISLSIVITELVIEPEISNGTSSDETCPVTIELKSSNSSTTGTYDWDEYTQGLILSSFYWGYIVTQIPGGILAGKLGGKYTLTLGVLSTSTLTLLTPLVVKSFDSTGLIIIRIAMGLGEGTIFPAVNFLIAQWAPPNERSKLCTVVMTGTQVGAILGTALSGALINNSSIGWPIVFYVFGSLGIFWIFIWIILGYNNPDVHPFIGEKEKTYLNDTTKEYTSRKVRVTPWRDILTSRPLWALLAAKFGHDWGFYTMVTDLPKYMSSVLHFSVQTNGLLSSLFYLLMWICSVTSSWLADWAIQGNKMSRTNVRKTCTTVAATGPAIFIMAASYAACDRVASVALFTIAMGLMGPFYPGVMVNPLDLSPNYSGILMAGMAAIGASAGIAAPYAVGVLTPNHTLSEWRLVFWISCVILLVSNLIFVISSDAEIQAWNNPDLKNQKQKNLENGQGPGELSAPPQSKEIDGRQP